MKCPCCGHDVGELPLAQLLSIQLTPTEERMLKVLVDRHPRGIKFDQMIENVYFIHDEPENSDRVIRTLMTRLRRKLEAVNWTIPRAGGGRGNNVFYRLEPL